MKLTACSFLLLGPWQLNPSPASAKPLSWWLKGSPNCFCSPTTARFDACPLLLDMAAANDIPLPLPAPAKDTCQEGSKRVRKNCVHGKYQPYCKQCRGSMLCEHLRHKNRCAICKRFTKATNSGATINFGIRVESVGPEVGSTWAVKLFVEMQDGQQWQVATLPQGIDVLRASAPVP